MKYICVRCGHEILGSSVDHGDGHRVHLHCDYETVDPIDPPSGCSPVDVLTTAGAAVTGTRHDDYGDALDDFTRIGTMWAQLLGVEEVTAEQVAACMIAVKLSRLTHTPNHSDSWVDIAGYAALGGSIAASPGRYL